MKNESLQNYDNSIIAKIVRKIVSFGEKMPRLSTVILNIENIDEFIVPVLQEFLEDLDNAVVELKIKDKPLFTAIYEDFSSGDLVIDFKDAEEEEFFELNPFATFYIQKGNKYICINRDNMYIEEELSKYKIKEALARSILYYISDKTIYNKDFGFKYKWINSAINEMLASYILNKECEKNLKQIEIMKKFLPCSKKYDEKKLFCAYIEGDTTYINKLIEDNILYNIEVILDSDNIYNPSKEDTLKNDMYNIDRINKLYIKHMLNLNTKKIKDESGIEYEKLYEKYYNILKDMEKDFAYTDKACKAKILEDVSKFVISKEEKSKNAVTRFLEYINSDVIYRGDYNNIEGKNLILKEILKIRSAYGEDVSLENIEIFNAYINAKNSLNKSKLDIEEETGRCIIKMCKDVKRVYKPREILDGKEIYTNESMLSYKIGKKSIKKITFIYDGTIKDEREAQKVCETKFNLKDNNEKEKFQKVFINKINLYSEFIMEIKEEQNQKIEIYEQIYMDYISKYISKRKNNLAKEGKRKEKIYNKIAKEKENTVIIQETKRIPEEEFLQNIDQNVTNILDKFIKLNEMYNEG